MDPLAQRVEAQIRAAVAAKDIWKPASSRVSGCHSRMMMAESAKLRIESARRSARTAASITAIITKERSAGTLPPDIRR